MVTFRKIALGVSGGVDSAVSAYLLKSKGYDVHGVFMKNWDSVNEMGICSAEKEFADAQIVCDKLKIPLTRVDFVKQYWNEIFSNLVSGYESGLTPNPDILCNKHVKFNHFYKYCRNTLNCDAIATGHYANTSFGPYLENYAEHESVRLLQAYDKHKDQTFFLSQIEQEPLRRTMFPIALLKKDKVRNIARNEGLLNVASKRDSTGICFVGKRNFQEFIEEYIESKPGEFIDIDTGKVVGTHKGIHQWTVGQRCRIGGNSQAYFILKKNTDNSIYVTLGTLHPALQIKYFTTDVPNWVCRQPDELKNNAVFKCRFRYQHTKPYINCNVMKTSNGLIVMLDETLRAITPGQYAVFYDDKECFGSAQILKTMIGINLLNR